MASSTSAALSSSNSSRSTSTSNTDVILSWAEPGDVKACHELIMAVTDDEEPMGHILYEDAKQQESTFTTVSWTYRETAEMKSDSDTIRLIKAVRVRDGRVVGVLQARKEVEVEVERRIDVDGYVARLEAEIDAEIDADANVDAKIDADANADADAESDSDSDPDAEYGIVSFPVTASVTVCSNHWICTDTDAGHQHTRLPMPEDLLEKLIDELTDEDCGCRINAWAIDRDLLIEEINIQRSFSEAAKPLGPYYNIDLLAIAPNMQRQGIGTRLVEYLRREHTDSIGFGLVAHCEADARGFFEKMGFEFKGSKASKTGQERMWLWSPAVAGRGRREQKEGEA